MTTYSNLIDCLNAALAAGFTHLDIQDSEDSLFTIEDAISFNTMPAAPDSPTSRTGEDIERDNGAIPYPGKYLITDGHCLTSDEGLSWKLLKGSPRMISLQNLYGDPISIYTRRQAIEDGVLIEAQDQQGRRLFRVPVAYTAAVYTQCIQWTEEDTRRRGVHQDQSGREWDVLWMLSCTAKTGELDRSRGLFKLYVVSREDGTSKSPKLTQLRAVFGPGDDGEPVITVMLPHED